MAFTHTKRALMGAAVVVALLGYIIYRRQGAAFGQRDFLVVCGALLLVLMNVIACYYFDRRAQQKQDR